MAEIRRYPFIRHLRSEASSHVLHSRGVRLLHSGRGLAFFFRPLSDSLAEVAMEDREITMVFHGRSADFQDLSAQVVLTYHVADPQKLAARVDFGIDLKTGLWLKSPLEKLTSLLTQLAQQHAWAYIGKASLKEILAEGHIRILEQVEHGMRSDSSLKVMGMETVSVRVSSVKPNADLEKAIAAPMREHIKQEADEAAFQRRALAVEKERAIQENELQNRIELAKRQEQLIQQQGQNARRQAQEDAESKRIATEAEGARARLNAQSKGEAMKIQAGAESESLRTKSEAEAVTLKMRSEAEAASLLMKAEAEAESVRQVDGARADLERAKLDAYRTMPPMVLMGLAAQELGKKLQRIDHLNLSPDFLQSTLTNLMEAGTQKMTTRS